MVCLGLMVSVGLVEGFLLSAFPISSQKLQLQKTSATFGWKLVLDLSVNLICSLQTLVFDYVFCHTFRKFSKN